MREREKEGVGASRELPQMRLYIGAVCRGAHQLSTCLKPQQFVSCLLKGRGVVGGVEGAALLTPFACQPTVAL